MLLVQTVMNMLKPANLIYRGAPVAQICMTEELSTLPDSLSHLKRMQSLQAGIILQQSNFMSN